MDVSKEVEFSDTKSLVSKRSPWKTKIIVSGVVAAVLLLGAVVSMAVYFSLTKQPPTRLVEVDLKEGETLTYRVDQHIQLQGSDVQKATIRAIVGIRVLNKTSEEYWLLMKFKLSQLTGNPAMEDHDIMTDYFLVLLHIASRPSSLASKKTSESFELFGPRNIQPELLRQVYSILQQLLPVVQRNHYEDVDGEKATGSNAPDPEESPSLPSSVQMHREANTSDKNVVFIRNHFDRADFVNLSSEIDFDLKYSDSASINKSNGMVTESHASFSEQLNLGEAIHDENGSDVKMMKIVAKSQVSLIELTNYFERAESESVRVHFFVRLSLPKAKATISVNEKPHNVTRTPSTNPLVSQTHNSTNSTSILLQRSRRSSNLDFSHTYKLFERKVVGVNIKAEAQYWVKENVSVTVSIVLSIGRYKRSIADKTYSWNELKSNRSSRISKTWPLTIRIYVPVFVFRIGVDFRLTGKTDWSLTYPYTLERGVMFAAQIKPSAEVKASIEGYLSAVVIKAGVYGDGTLVRVGLPAKLSLQVSPFVEWCATLSAELTALELSAGLYYRWCVPFFGCGSRRTISRFGSWAAYRRNWKLMERCA